MKNKILVAAIGIIVLAGVGYAVSTKKADDLGDAAGGTSLAGSEDAGRNDTPDTAMDGVFRGSLQQLAARGGNYECTFTVTNAGQQSSGTIFVSGENIRNDSTTVTTEGNVESHMIIKDGYMYSWSPMMETGMKMKLTPGGGSTGSQGSANIDQPYDYNCSARSADASKFALPEGVSFMQFGQ